MSESEKDELEFLRWFAANADFGPSEGEVRMFMRKDYERETGKKVPDRWRGED